MGKTLKVVEEHKQDVLTIFIQNGDRIYPYFRTKDASVYNSILAEIKQDVSRRGAIKVYLGLYKVAKNTGCISLI